MEINKCLCGQIGSIYCIQKRCKNCCRDNNCIKHFVNFNCVECNKQLNKSYKNIPCYENKCNECCKSSKCKKHKNHLRCIICKNRYFNKKCSNKNCDECCNFEECKTHLNENNKCENCNETIFSTKCSKKICKYCICDTKNCDTHYKLCKCGVNKIEKKNKCKVCKDCCKDYKCYLHYVQDESLSTDILNKYKIQLYLLNKFPIEIINIIIDEYVDARTDCNICKYKFTFDYDIDYGNAVACQGCYQWACNDAECSKSFYFGCIEYYCIKCAENVDDDESYFDSDSDFYDEFSD